ncbi:DUF6745 domain-containing protein [Nonomuraea indica]|uniref:DUF6745 domain-containing protein n=1 Tax=Nonomuraea indica TaxID=1581193 RepID=A0ABW7ZWV7_9ACTN
MSVLVQREAAAIREEWLGRASSTRPADRPAAEAAITGLYTLIGEAPPRFHWVSSPATAVATLPPGVRPRPSQAVEHLPSWPLPPRLKAVTDELRRDLDASLTPIHRRFDQVIRDNVGRPLARSAAALRMPLQGAHDSASHRRTSWYDTLCVSWLAHYDALRRIGGADFPPEASRRLGLWTAVARSCRWWWPREGVCTVAERPVALHTEAWGDDGEVRLHRADGPAVRYADGWEVHAWHGTRVPAWVIEDPDVRRIAREPNVEVRRCAVERLGWTAYIEQAGLRLVATAPDPGNPGAHLRLYDLRENARVLVAVNGSVERDGTRRGYGLTVPRFLDDPVAAAGWTYGLSAAQYSLLARRT